MYVRTHSERGLKNQFVHTIAVSMDTAFNKQTTTALVLHIDVGVTIAVDVALSERTTALRVYQLTPSRLAVAVVERADGDHAGSPFGDSADSENYL